MLAEETYASTLENSCDGCITKLSEEGVHEMRCEMVLSSSMLYYVSLSVVDRPPLLPETHLYSLCIKAVWTILG